ncbi:MAG: hypothetical protein E6H46_10680 [Betaproteobacteria bacterium]|nr:MAG: hypothetical protein E6H46_10680 [Betaproteobacteria bacterium]
MIRLGRLALTSVLLSFFAGAGFALAIFHGSGHAVPTSARGAQAIAGAAVLLDAVVVAVLLARSGRTTDIEERLRRWLVTVQCALPLLGLVPLPPQLSYQGSREPYVWPVTLLVLLLAYAVVTWARLSARFLPMRREGQSTLQLALEPLAVAMIAPFFTAPSTTLEMLSATGYPTIPGDDFQRARRLGNMNPVRVGEDPACPAHDASGVPLTLLGRYAADARTDSAPVDLLAIRLDGAHP